MKKVTFLFCLYILFWGVSNAQQVDSTTYFYSNFNFQKVIHLLEEKQDKTGNDFFLLAKSYQQLGQLQEAEDNYLHSLEKDSSNVIVLNSIASFYSKQDKLNEASSTYKKLLSYYPENSFYQKKLAQVYVTMNDPIKAIIHFQEALKLNGKDVESSIQLAKLLVKIGQTNTADSLVKIGLSQYPEQKSLLKLGVKIAYQRRNYNQLTLYANQLFKLNDSSIVTQRLCGIAYYHLKDYQKANRFFANVLKTDKDSEIIHYYYGLSHRELGNLKVAEELLEKAINLGVTENLANYYTQLAVVYEEKGEYDKSIQSYKAAYKSSKNKLLLYHLARNYDIYYKDKSIAINYYERYLEENDTANKYYLNYSKYRVKELKIAKHFELDTLE